MSAARVSLWAVASVPNLLTLLRILLIPVLVVLLTDPSPRASALAAATFFLACWSDFFDGYLARRHGLGSTFGKLLDPLADKLLVMAALVMLVGLDREPRVPAWIVVLIVGREIAVTGLRAVALISRRPRNKVDGLHPRRIKNEADGLHPRRTKNNADGVFTREHRWRVGGGTGAKVVCKVATPGAMVTCPSSPSGAFLD